MEKQENEPINSNMQDNKNKNNKKFIIGYIIFLIILIFVTIFRVYLKIEKINEAKNEEKIIVTTEEKEKSSDESKYLITSYKETYNDNSIKIIDYYDIDGKIVNKYEYDEDYAYNIKYIQIEGLKNKTVEKNINERLKKKAYELKEKHNAENVYTYVDANFANVLSVSISTDIVGQMETINIDLSTGNDIKFKDLFLPSTPINSILTDSFYETLAWYYSYNNEEFIDDMSKVDWSDTEEKFLQLINKYNKNKDNLKFSVSPNYITIHGLIDKDIIDYEYVSGMDIYIDLTKYIGEVTFYKKYLTKNSIYEDDSIGKKNTIVFTNNDVFETRIYYGFLKDNIFFEEVVLDYEGNYYKDDNLKYVRKLIEELSEKTKKQLIEETSKKQGKFYQIEYYIINNEEDNYICVEAGIYQATCSIEYFKNDAFLDYIKMKSMPRGDAMLNGFSKYQDFPNLQISETKIEEYYISKTGETITKEETLKKLNTEIKNEEREDKPSLLVVNVEDEL